MTSGRCSSLDPAQLDRLGHHTLSSGVEVQYHSNLAPPCQSDCLAVNPETDVLAQAAPTPETPTKHPHLKQGTIDDIEWLSRKPAHNQRDGWSPCNSRSCAATPLTLRLFLRPQIDLQRDRQTGCPPSEAP